MSEPGTIEQTASHNHPQPLVDAQDGHRDGHTSARVTLVPDRQEGIWHAVREALRGSRRNYTEGPIGRAILVLAIPMVLEMAMESIFVICDVFFVGKLGADAVATVGLTESLMAFL
jgi:hypothetical protein